MNWKLKAVLVKLENMVLYLAVGLLWGRFLISFLLAKVG
jgi:hypothetical protein